MWANFDTDGNLIGIASHAPNPIGDFVEVADDDPRLRAPLPAPQPPPDLVAILLAKGVINQADIDGNVGAQIAALAAATPPK